jgi:hypothetical protein
MHFVAAANKAEIPLFFLTMQAVIIAGTNAFFQSFFMSHIFET